jgi:hypothetical protein
VYVKSERRRRGIEEERRKREGEKEREKRRRGKIERKSVPLIPVAYALDAPSLSKFTKFFFKIRNFFCLVSIHVVVGEGNVRENNRKERYTLSHREREGLC